MAQGVTLVLLVYVRAGRGFVQTNPDVVGLEGGW